MRTCAQACHESAIAIVDGKAKLIRDDYCDGMGDCLPKCPTGAISFEQRDAAEYDRAAVERNMRKKMPGACPGSKMRAISRNEETESKSVKSPLVSRLCNWPVQTFTKIL